MQDNNISMRPTVYRDRLQPSEPAREKTHSPKRKLILFGGVTLAIALIVAGIFVQFTSEVRDENGRSIADLDKEITSIKDELAPMYSKQLEIYHSEGMSDNYFAQTELVSQKEDQQIELEKSRNVLAETEADKSLRGTGALYFFIGALFIFAISFIAFKIM